MNLLYVIQMGCPVCLEAKKALLFTNARLPVEERIETVDIFSGDPRLAFISEFYKSDSPGDWYVPLLVCDKPEVGEMFRSCMLARGKRACVHACWTWKHYHLMLLKYLEA